MRPASDIFSVLFFNGCCPQISRNFRFAESMAPFRIFVRMICVSQNIEFQLIEIKSCASKLHICKMSYSFLSKFVSYI